MIFIGTKVTKSIVKRGCKIKKQVIVLDMLAKNVTFAPLFSQSLAGCRVPCYVALER
jgi:hypothetical protein